MWEVLKRAPRGRISLRNLSLLATGILVAVLLNLGITHTALAEDVTRTTDGFYYQNKPFSTQVTIQPGDPRNLATSATGEVTAYENINPEQTKAEYIYFAKGVDPKTATTALYTTFDYRSPSTYSNQSPSPPQTVTIADGEVPLQATNVGGCQVPGIGWLMCPSLGFLAGAIDDIHRVVMSFLDVPPMLTNSPIYDIWNMIRSIANIAFVIIFLIVIFSQVTSIGISAYGIRKALPRLIVAAILVNISFYICALGIDLSNYLGHGIYAMLYSSMDILNDVRVNVTWSEIAAWVLGGGTAAIGTGVVWLSVATAGSFYSALFTLLGMAITVGLSILTAFIILAVRHALLILLTIISPLAFVALVLPSTEKWFTKWKDTTLTLLIMFPIFSLVFAGAQLAGAAIILGSPDNVYMAILGKAVQFIPLAIAPIIVRFSTGILGTIAKMTNDRNKGLVDRAKNWTDSQADHHRKKLLAGQASWFGRQRKSWRINGLRGIAQGFDNQKRNQAMEQEGFESASAARAMSTVRYRNAYNRTQDYGADKQTQENQLKGQYDNLRRNDGETLMREVRRRQSEVYAKKEAESVERMHADITAKGAADPNLQRVMSSVQNADVRTMTLANANQIKLDAENIAFEGMSKRLAEAEHKSVVSKRLSEDRALRQQIGAIRGTEGEHLVHAMAIAEDRKQFGEFVNARKEIMKHFKVGSYDTSQLAMGHNVDKTRDGVTLTFDADDQYTREAAIDNVFQVGAYKDIMRVIESTGVGGINYDYRATAQESLLRNGKTKIAPFLNDKALDAILNGQYTGPEFTMKQVVRRIAEGRLTGDDISSSNANALELMFTSGRAINDVAHPDHAQWQNALNNMLADASPADRPQLEMDYHTYFGQMRRTVIETLKDPDFRRSTSSQSVTAMRRFIGIADSENIDRIDWETDPRF